MYGPGGGKLALMNGQTLAKGFVPLSGGATAVYNSSGLAYYRHADWLGSSRLASTPSRAVYYDGAYAPYGENYAEVGTTDRNFTGQNQDTVSSGPYPLYDFLYREYNPTQGRWISPDPAGLAAVDPADPQTWNRYAYARNNPLLTRDRLGLQGDDDDDDDDWDWGWDWGWGDGGADFNVWLWYGWGWAGSSPVLGPTQSAALIPSELSGPSPLWGMGFPSFALQYLAPGGGDLSDTLPPVTWMRPPAVPWDLVVPPACSDLFSLGGMQTPYAVSTDFLAPETVNRITYTHPGMDFPALKGTSIIVNFTGTLSSQTGPVSGFGNAIVLMKPTGVPGISTSVLFGHGPATPGLVPGMTIYAGTQIGTVGNLGLSTGANGGFHVHVQRTGNQYSATKGPLLQPCHQ